MTGSDSIADPGNDFVVAASGVAKAFGRRRICADISFELHLGDRLAIVGPNGSGKTTFLKILCGLSRPDKGTISYRLNDAAMPRNRWHESIGLVAPDLALYDELTALENIRFLNNVGGWGKTNDHLCSLIDQVGLAGREYDLLGTFSSGMKQRLKYAAALVKAPPLLLLDEPTANFDETGAAIFHEVIQRQRAVGICILATNNRQEAELAERQIVMGG